MSQQIDYNINLDVKYAPKERIDVDALVAECTDQWFNQTLTQVNDSVVRLGILKGVTIPKGVMHKPVAPEKTVVLMVETSAVQPTGD